MPTTVHTRPGSPAPPAPTAGGPVLECTGLTRRFGERTAVDGVTLRITAGETFGLLGPNGAGKTTVIRMICGLLAPDAGSVRIAGTPLRSDSRAARAVIGYVPQDVALYPDLTARENLRFFGRMYRLGGRALSTRVTEVLDLVGLADRGDERVESFSGGMKRRLNIGAGLLHRPTLLVLDEPTVGVDPQSRHAILESVRSFGTAGMAVLYTTHYMEEAERICDRVGIIDHGRLVAEGTRRELIAQLQERDRIELDGTGDLVGFAEACAELPDVSGVSTTSGGVHLLATSGATLLPAVLDLATRLHLAVRSVRVVEPDLESVFLHLTGSALRE